MIAHIQDQVDFHSFVEDLMGDMAQAVVVGNFLKKLLLVNQPLLRTKSLTWRNTILRITATRRRISHSLCKGCV